MQRATLLLAVLSLHATSSGSEAQNAFNVSSAPPPGYNRASGQRDARAHLAALIRLDTQNPPGNEMRTAEYFDSVLTRIPGIETRILDVGNGRANFVARLRATSPTKRPVLVMGHMDVVGADTAKWDTPPFEATERDGFLYGRGAIDDKGPLAATVTALVQLAAQRDRLKRDIILLATAAEEGGSVGIDWVVDSAFDLIREAEFAVNEGGRVRMRDGRLFTVNIQTTEKVSYNVVASARGPSGHGSVPLPDNALAALARAVARVHDWRSPARLNETTRLYFARLAQVEPNPAMRAAMRSISAAGADSAAIATAAVVLSREPLHNAVLHTTGTLTLVGGGIRSNVIPSEGSATFNVRALPGEDIRAVVQRMNEVGGEEQVTFELQGEPAADPPPSPVATDLFTAMEQAAKAMSRSVVVIPFMSTGATDGAALRARGIPTYGILPFPLEMEDELRMHGDNERVPVRALGWGTEYIYRVLHGVAR
ncbi:MAG TPA: M20/M25/M40 family metallo-hydrolase [Gemmatimonadaceae bacterium]|nr:M20/M25/M40 family metallo-hydrolase [Gemmatimonadaceae bacterium]